jgi:predicted O-methyltransferase YrrM
MLNLEKALQIKGWMSPDELNFLARTASEASITVEFGCFLGRSTRAIADNTPGIVYAVDPWNGLYFKDDNKPIDLFHINDYTQFKENLADHISVSKVIPMRLYSWEFPFKAGSVDFVFIDGDHRFEYVVEDIKLAERLVKPGGMIAGHDYTHQDWPGVKKAVDLAYNKVGRVDSIWWIRKS